MKPIDWNELKKVALQMSATTTPNSTDLAYQQMANHYQTQINGMLNGAMSSRPPQSIQKRLDQRRQKAEEELIRIAKLQKLLDSLPPGCTEADLSSLMNI